MEAARQALSAFKALLQELVSGSVVERAPPKLTRNPLEKLRRYFEAEPGFEELVAKYATLLPVLEMPSESRYAEIALIGIKALRARRLAIAKNVYEEVRYRTAPSSALVSVMKGVLIFTGCLVFLTAIFCITALAITSWNGASLLDVWNVVSSLQTPLQTMVVVVLFGCLGSVVSLLLRLTEFENMKGRSKAFLILYGATLPIVGGIFAAVLGSILNSEVIQIGKNNFQTFVVIGFLSGFSERFTRNILRMAEDTVSPRSGSKYASTTDDRLSPAVPTRTEQK